MWRPIARSVLLFLGVAGSCLGQAGGSPSGELKQALKEGYVFSALPASDREPTQPANDEPILRLDTFTVTMRPAFDRDLYVAAQREAGRKAAAKFSPIKGGLIFSQRIGVADLDLGIWPKLLLQKAGFVRPAGVMLSVDVLRLNW
jgi:hypothetical protein